MSRTNHKSQIVFALCTVVVLAVMLSSSPRSERVQAQATQAASVQACAGIDASATMPADMSMPGMTASAAATMDMGGMNMSSAVSTMQATAAMDMSGMGSMNSTQPAGNMNGMVMTTPTTMAMQATSAADMGSMNMVSAATPGAPTLHIISPTEGQTIKGSEVEVKVDVSNLTIDAQNHLHIYLDGQIAAMAYSSDAKLENVSAGIHDLCVIVANAEHVDSSLKAGVSFVVAP